MTERKLYKTKLCVLYQRGRCSRQSCSFAHGDAELRRFPSDGSFDGRREYQSTDLRDRLERRYSPYRKHSPGRNVQGRHGFRNHKQVSHDRGYSPSRSPVRRSERQNENLKKVDGQSDLSISPRISDGDEGKYKDGNKNTYKERDLQQKLRETKMDIQYLEDNRSQLKSALNEKKEEVAKLSSTIEDIEAQLKKERDDCKRSISKNKKFNKALGRFLQAQVELKRSQSKLQRVADQLDSDTLKLGVNEEDSSINIVSDGDYEQFSKHEKKNCASPPKKRSRLSIGTSEEMKQGSLKDMDKLVDHPSRTEKLITTQFENSQRESDASKSVLGRNDNFKPRVDEHKQRLGRSGFIGTASDKVSNMGNTLPVSMAAQAVDELIEAIEMEEKSGALEATTEYQNGPVHDKAGLPFPPPPPPKFNPNAYNQYEGDDEDVDIEEIDGEMGCGDGNSEVDIMKD